MKRAVTKLLGMLLALALFLTLLPAVSAASAPVLGYIPRTDGSAELRVEGLDGTDVYAVQLELVFDGEFPDVKFSPADSNAYQPDRAPAVENGTTTVTVYLVDGDKPLGRGRTLVLGTLSMGGKFTMPSTAKLSALDENARPLSGADNATVQTRQRTDDSGTVVPTPTPTPGAMPFTDVEPRHWFYSAVKFVFDKGMMSGMTATAFGPDTQVNRGMIVTILYRMEGSPAAGAPKFGDVPAEKYYAKAIAWATENGIASGYPNGRFEPESSITREQLAAMLYRYAVYKGYGVTAQKELSGFADAGDVSDYAADSVRWAVGAGLLSGVTGTTLAPKGSATRAQAASILMRFCQTAGK